MRTHWGNRPIEGVATVFADAEGFWVDVPQHLVGPDGYDCLQVTEPEEWSGFAPFSTTTLDAAALAMRPTHAPCLKWNLYPQWDAPVTIVGGEGIDWLVREAPESCISLLQSWVHRGIPEAYHRRQKDAILVLTRDMFWPALIMLEPDGHLSVIALDFEGEGKVREDRHGLPQRFVSLPARLDWRAISTLDFAVLRQGTTSAKAAETILAYFREHVIPTGDFLRNDDLEGPKARFLTEPSFCVGDLIEERKFHQNRTGALKFKSGSIEELLEVLEAAIGLAVGSALTSVPRSHLELVPAWYKTAFCTKPARLDYSGPGEGAVQKVAAEITRVMAPSGWSIIQLDGNRREGAIVSATEISTVIEGLGLTGHDALENAGVLRHWLMARAGWTEAAADQVIQELTQG